MSAEYTPDGQLVIRVEAIGLAHRPGRNTIKMDIKRSIIRLLIHLSRIVLFPPRWRSYLVYWAWHVLPIGGASMSNAAENAILLALFNATAWANVIDNAASSPITNIHVSLHTADPGEGGDQTTSEATYTSYARIPVARTSGGWTVTANSVSPVAAINFAAATGGSNTITHWGVGKSLSGAGVLWFSGTVTPNIAVSSPIAPSLGTGTAVTLD